MRRDGAVSDDSEISATYRPRLARRWLAAVALATAIAACDSSPPSVEAADDCSDLVDVAVAALVEVRDNAVDLTRQDFEGLSEQSVVVVDPYLQIKEDIQDRSEVLVCDSEQLSADFERRLSKLETRSVGGAVILLEAYGFLNPFENVD